MCETIVLSESGAKAFFETLDNPPEPNEKLKAAASDYFEFIGSGSGD